ncbi:hypothetical protein TWF569_006883 [Orbilia oligospora]|nr:hypothetical protein TWF569_006883 [Orbilia oligospora]
MRQNSTYKYRIESIIYLLTVTAAGLATGSTYGDKELVDTGENATHENYHGEFQKAAMRELSKYPHMPTHIEEYDQKPQLLETFQTVWTKSPHEARCGPSGEDSVISKLGPHVKVHKIVKEEVKTSTNYLYGSIGVMVLNFFVGGFM